MMRPREQWIVLWDPPINKLRVARIFDTSEEAHAFATEQKESGWPMNIEIIHVPNYLYEDDKKSSAGTYSVRLDHEREEDCSVLIIERNGKVVEEETDRGEPEDQSFYRDWSWVPGALERAYAFGQEDAQDISKPKMKQIIMQWLSEFGEGVSANEIDEGHVEDLVSLLSKGG